MLIIIPNQVDYVLNKINEHGYESYIVGGCVRDSLLYKNPKDWDITTSATPQEIINIFTELGHIVIETGVKYGTVTLIIDDMSIEVTTFRTEGKYNDGRKPSEVQFTPSLEEDLKRRDFTINSMAYHPVIGLIDSYGGKIDLSIGLIKAVGNPEERLKEDYLRAIRAIRFASQLNFEIEIDTYCSIMNNRNLMINISRERIANELSQILLSTSIKQYKTLAYLLFGIVPEFSFSFLQEQNNPYHIYTVGDHTIKTIENVEKELILRLSAFFHDLGKNSTKTTDEQGIDHFYRHAEKSCDIAIRTLTELRFSSLIIDKVSRLVLHHDNSIGTDATSVKRTIRKIGEDIFLDIIKLKMADIKAQNPQYLHRLEKMKQIMSTYNQIIKDEQCFKIKDLAINGNDIMQILNLEKGVKVVGNMLEFLLERVIENPQLNERGKLVKIVQEKSSQHC